MVAIPVAVATGVGAVMSGGATPFLNHQFVMVETRKWLYVVAKGKGGCECYRGPYNLKQHFLDTQKQYAEATRALQSDPTPVVLKEDKGNYYQIRN